MDTFASTATTSRRVWNKQVHSNLRNITLVGTKVHAVFMSFLVLPRMQ